ncbi:gametocyte-specific factor 1 homolog [Haemaphysalis longicornis]
MAHWKKPQAFLHGEDPLVMCPYNPEHKVRKDCLEIHIPGCRDEYRRTLVNCRDNSSPLVPRDGLHHHLAFCPERCSAGQANHQSAGAAEADAVYPTRASRNLPEPYQCWDKDAAEWESWRIFCPVQIGARPADRRAFCGALNAAPRPPSGASQSP